MGGVQEEKKCPVTKVSDATRLFTAVFFRWATAFGLALPPGRHKIVILDEADRSVPPSLLTNA